MSQEKVNINFGIFKRLKIYNIFWNKNIFIIKKKRQKFERKE